MQMQAEKIINACGFSAPDSPLASADDDDNAIKDGFYKKLTKLHHSSGLSSVFNFRETNLDLHLLYQEVIQRRGFYQVTEAGKWDEVELALKLKSGVSMLPVQLQKVYEILLLQYEQVYCKSPDESDSSPDKYSPASDCLRTSVATMVVPTDFKATPGSSTGKRKQLDGNPDDHEKKRKSAGPKVNKKSTVIASPDSYVKDLSKDPDAPMKPRTGYHIFLRLECNRLKLIHGENFNSTNIRNMASRAWKALSEKDKKPYLEASRIDRERYGRELARYMSRGKSNNVKSENLFSNTPATMVSFSPSSGVVDDYHVSLNAEADSENIQVPDESMVELAVEAMKNARSNDSMFQIDLSGGFLDIAN